MGTDCTIQTKTGTYTMVERDCGVEIVHEGRTVWASGDSELEWWAAKEAERMHRSGLLMRHRLESLDRKISTLDKRGGQDAATDEGKT